MNWRNQNLTNGEIQSVTPLSNGSFSGRIRGQLGDEIKVVLMDSSGNQTTISYLTFKSPGVNLGDLHIFIFDAYSRDDYECEYTKGVPLAGPFNYP